MRTSVFPAQALSNAVALPGSPPRSPWVGIVLGLEVSRLARNNADWYRLLDLCGLTDTLIGDADGIYHPAMFNDRLVLGLKGTMRTRHDDHHDERCREARPRKDRRDRTRDRVEGCGCGLYELRHRLGRLRLCPRNRMAGAGR